MLNLNQCPRPRPARSAEGVAGVPRSEFNELWGFHGSVPLVQVQSLRPNKSEQHSLFGFIFLSSCLELDQRAFYNPMCCEATLGVVGRASEKLPVAGFRAERPPKASQNECRAVLRARFDYATAEGCADDGETVRPVTQTNKSERYLSICIFYIDAFDKIFMVASKRFLIQKKLYKLPILWYNNFNLLRVREGQAL